MNLTLVTLLALTCLVGSCSSQYRDSYDDDPHVESRRCVCSQRSRVRCPRVGYCPTRIVRMCGCCPACYRLLDAGERCERRVPLNEMCRRPMMCMSGVCQRSRYQNRYK